MDATTLSWHVKLPPGDLWQDPGRVQVTAGTAAESIEIGAGFIDAEAAADADLPEPPANAGGDPTAVAVDPADDGPPTWPFFGAEGLALTACDLGATVEVGSTGRNAPTAAGKVSTVVSGGLAACFAGGVDAGRCIKKTVAPTATVVATSAPDASRLRFTASNVATPAPRAAQARRPVGAWYGAVLVRDAGRPFLALPGWQGKWNRPGVLPLWPVFLVVLTVALAAGCSPTRHQAHANLTAPQLAARIVPAPYGYQIDPTPHARGAMSPTVFSQFGGEYSHAVVAATRNFYYQLLYVNAAPSPAPQEFHTWAKEQWALLQ